MKITVIRAFNDMTIPADQDRRREVGAEFDATDERAMQLIALRLADTEANLASDGAAGGLDTLSLAAGNAQTGANAAPLPSVEHE